jgi:hypothetical protein
MAHNMCIFFFWMALQPLWALASFRFPDLFTIGTTPWTSDQLVARPLPKHRTAQTQNKHIYIPNIHALSGIQTHDHSLWANEDSSCLRSLGDCDQLTHVYLHKIRNTGYNLLELFSCKLLKILDKESFTSKIYWDQHPPPIGNFYGIWLQKYELYMRETTVM